MNNRTELAKYFNKLGFKRGAEIGVADGRYSLTLCENIPGLELICVDPYRQYGENIHDGSQKQLDKCLRTAKERLKEYDVNFLKDMSLVVAEDTTDECLDFVYIDANHLFDYVMQDIICWTRKVKKGGIVSGHDYWDIANFGVVDAVNIYTKVHGYKLNIIEGVKSNKRSERSPNWWFVKT